MASGPRPPPPCWPTCAYSARAAGALLGVTPLAHDGGSHESRRYVCGGRAETRCALYLASLTAIRHNPTLTDLYQRLRERGKQAKMAHVAVIRKLVAHADALLRADRPWQLSPSSAQVPACTPGTSTLSLKSPLTSNTNAHLSLEWTSTSLSPGSAKARNLSRTATACWVGRVVFRMARFAPGSRVLS